MSDGMDIDFDDLEVNKNRSQTQSAKAFAAQRRKVKPNRKHASRNPVKVLQSRDDVHGDEELESEDENQSIINGEQHDLKVIGRNSGLKTGKIKEREHALTDDAKKGLQSVEDISKASRSLRMTEKDKRTGIGTEKTNLYDGIKDVMFFHIKGARHIQTRLVQPCTSSMNSGDVFILVTPKYVHQWNGKNCSIMEKSRGSEVSSVIHQWKELGCNASSTNIMDEGREKASSMTSNFWKILGDKKEIKEIDDVLSDKDCEKGLLLSNKFYEIQCEDPNSEDAVCSLELIEEYSGKVPSKKWLDSNKAYVIDFGTEVYSWIGRFCKGATRKKAVDVGQEQFEKEYSTTSNIHPFNLNEENTIGTEPLPRPAWAVYGRMAEKTENVAFRRKFFDWPDPVDLKVKTVEAKVHAQLTKEYSNDPFSTTLLPIPSRTLSQPTAEPVMVLDGSFIGRGCGMQDSETLFRYGVVTNELTIWQVSGSNMDEVPNEKFGVFFSAEAYIIKWNFQVFRTGIKSLKGGKSRQDDVGKDRIVFYFWQGEDCSASDRGTAALMTVDLDTEEGPQIPVEQGKEPPAFFQLFDGKMAIHSGRSNNGRLDLSGTHMYWVRNEVTCEACVVEVELSSASLRSRGSFIVLKDCNMFLWHGDKAVRHTRKIAEQASQHFLKKLPQSYKLIEMSEGDETDAFWDALEDEENYMSYLEVDREFLFTPRCFAFDSLHGYFQHTEITSSAYHPDHLCPFPMLQSNLHELSQPGLVFVDNNHRLYLWQGWWPASDDVTIDTTGPNTRAEKHRFDVNRKLAMQSIKAYANDLGRPLSRTYIVHAGCEPLEFTNLFPYWRRHEEITQLQLDAGHSPNKKQKLIPLLAQLEKEEYTLAELMTQPLPEGVDPTRIEDYLNKEEFQKLFGVAKENFNKLPRWKQIELKKKSCLF